MYIDFIKKSAQAGFIMGLLLPPKQVGNQLLSFFLYSFFFNAHSPGVSKVAVHLSLKVNINGTQEAYSCTLKEFQYIFALNQPIFN